MKFNNRNVSIDSSARIGDGVRIGDNTVIYPNVEIGEGTVIANDCVIGEPSGDYYENPQHNQPKTIIGKNCLIRSHSIVYAGCQFGNQFQTGHRVCIRERTMIGDDCRVGTLCDLQGDLSIGNNSWLHSGNFLAKGTTIHNYVIVYPHCVFLDDKYPPSNHLGSPSIGDYSQIGARSIIMPSVKIGKHVLVASGSTVTKDFDSYDFVSGSPAKRVKDIRDIQLPGGELAYPWPYRFDRGMPWAGIGYQDWLNQQES
jgi:acetyltransferase-like isoleucine patch superfamily enzyme